MTTESAGEGGGAGRLALEEKIEALEARVAELEQVEARYQRMLHSKSWRVTVPLRRLSTFYLRFGRLLGGRTFTLTAGVHRDLEQTGEGVFRVTGDSPEVTLAPRGAAYPSGWVRLRGRWEAGDWAVARLGYADGYGFSADQRRDLAAEEAAGGGQLVRLPERVFGMRLAISGAGSQLRLPPLEVREVGLMAATAALIGERFRAESSGGAKWFTILGEILRVIRADGLLGLQAAIRHARGSDYEGWVGLCARLTEVDRAAIVVSRERFRHRPLISILMPVFDPPERYLRAAIDSVRGQLYPHWELCVADDASTRPGVRRILEEFQATDERIKVCFRERNGHISAASNSALEMATGDYLALLDHDDVLADHALYMVAAEIDADPRVNLIYSDEDKVDGEGHRRDPYFKPDWNPELFLAQNFINHLTVYRAELVRERGGFRVGLEGSQDWDLALRVIEGIPAATIRHIPHVLYHWRAIAGSTAQGLEEKGYVHDASRRALEEHFQRIGQPGVMVETVSGRWRIRYPVPEPAPKVSLIMPTRNTYEVFRRCVESIFEKTDYPNFELVVVDNQSDDPRILEYFDQLVAEHGARVLRYDAPFNYSAINNFAVKQVDGELLGLLNNDLEVISSEWLREMVSHARRPEVGAVGAKLYYPNDTIQHAGVILGVGGVAGHAYVQKPRRHTGQMDRCLLVQNLSAVTAACLLVRRRVFEEAGGLDEENLAVAFNDVDLCLRIRELGYQNVWTPYAELYHHESISRGYEDTPEKQARFRGETNYMRSRWGDALERDPHYNPNLSLESAYFQWSFSPRAAKPWSIATQPRGED